MSFIPPDQNAIDRAAEIEREEMAAFEGKTIAKAERGPGHSQEIRLTFTDGSTISLYPDDPWIYLSVAENPSWTLGEETPG